MSGARVAPDEATIGAPGDTGQGDGGVAEGADAGCDGGGVAGAPDGGGMGISVAATSDGAPGSAVVSSRSWSKVPLLSGRPGRVVSGIATSPTTG